MRKLTKKQVDELERIFESALQARKGPWEACLEAVQHALAMKKAPRRTHYGIFATNLPGAPQAGCTWARNFASAVQEAGQVEGVRRLSVEKCAICRGRE